MSIQSKTVANLIYFDLNPYFYDAPFIYRYANIKKQILYKPTCFLFKLSQS